jgi:O-antigen/teichoic acid export membrane protein
MQKAAEAEKVSSRHLSFSRGLIRNVMSNWGAYVLSMGVNFFLSPYVVRRLGNTGYGVWTLILSLTGYLGLLDLGVRGAVTRYVAKFHAESEDGRASNLASSAMMIFSSAGLFAVLTSGILAAFVVDKMRIPPQYLLASKMVLVITGLNIAASLVNGVFGGVVVGLQRFDLANGIEIVNSILRAATIVLILHLGYGIVTLAFIQLGFTLTRLAANIGLARHLYPRLKVAIENIDRAGIKMIFSFSLFSFMLQVGASLIYATDNIVIGSYLPVAALTFYVIAGNLAEYSRTFVEGISQTMMPFASSTEAGGDSTKLRRLVLFSSRAGTMVMLPVAVTFMLRGSSFIRLWMGEEYADPSGKVLWILSLMLVFWSANGAVAGSMLGLSKHKPLVLALLPEGLCNLSLSIYLVQKMGIVGVAWGTVIPSLLSALVFWPWYIQKTLGISPITYGISAWLRPMLAIVPFACGSYAVERYWTTGHLIVFFVQVLFTLPLAIAGYWMVCFEPSQRESVWRKFSDSLVRVFGRSEAN